MPKRYTVRELIRLVERDGWFQVGQTGSHRQYKHLEKPGRVTIAGHLSDQPPQKTVRSILEQAQIEREH